MKATSAKQKLDLSLFNELKRRNVFKVAAAYIIVAWLLLQVVDVIAPMLALPNWAGKFVLLLLGIGFPVALIFAWAYELTPEGLKREHEADGAQQITDHSETKREQEIVDGVMPNSISVLPFENLSPNPEDAYFSAGIHEEILNQLAKIKDLSVIARTSMMQYAGAARAIPEIAAELRVGVVMEGSVRYSGDQVRVTAQLIDGAAGTHIWTETYDGSLTDIFAIQSNVAKQIAEAMNST